MWYVQLFLILHNVFLKTHKLKTCELISRKQKSVRKLCSQVKSNQSVMFIDVKYLAVCFFM
jgi:hypothetical protein